MSYNPHIHQRRSIRLHGYDYSQAGMYFVTICTHQQECIFGNIENGIVELNDGGSMAEKYWLSIPKHFPKVVLHEFVIMPNHVHGTLELTNEIEILPIANVGAENLQPLPEQQAINRFQRAIPRSIGTILKGFKIGVTKWFRANTDVYNVWQRNYHEHIIRDTNSYTKISEYILNNPANWPEDKFYR